MTDIDNMEAIYREAIDVSKDVADFIRTELNKITPDQIEEKDKNSLVSYVDKTAEEMIVKRLSKILPEAGFITEEDTVTQSSESAMVWIIDPLDGTTNFLHKIPHFGVSIALRKGNEIIIGVVYDVMREECFHACKGMGSFCNDRKISVSDISNVSESMLATGFPYSNTYDKEPLINTLKYWLTEARGIRRFGAAAVDLCFVASGRIECYYETSLNIWDVAAGILIVEEAGGTVTDYFGLDSHLKGGHIVASNAKIHNEIVDQLIANYKNR